MEDYKDIKDRVGEALSYEERMHERNRKLASIAKAVRPDKTALEIIKMQQAAKEKLQSAVVMDGATLSEADREAVADYMLSSTRKKVDFTNFDSEGNEVIRWSDGLFYWISADIDAIKRGKTTVSDRFLQYVREVKKL